MKSVTEFPTHKLIQGLNKKKELADAGKTPEEISAGLGEAMKLEGDKLKYFMAAIEVAGQNLEKLSRVLVVTFAEGESVPPKATKVEEHHYIPEFQVEARKPVTTKKVEQKGGRDKGRKGGGKPKESPWGLSPEEKAAKKGGGAKKPAATAPSSES